jgi:hypothetical protein
METTSRNIMNKSQLKKLIKPVVKECIQEVLIEEGLLTEVVSQVTAGLAKQPIVEPVWVWEKELTFPTTTYLMKTCKCSVSPERRIRNYKSIAESYWTQLAMMPIMEWIFLRAQSP